MACASGTINITTGAVGTTFTVSGLSFQPTAILFNWSGRTTIGSANEFDHRWGAGFATSTSSRRAYTSASDHGVGTSAADNNRFNDCCIGTLTTTGATDGKADLNAINADGFQLIIDDTFAVALAVQWFAWDATNAEIVDFNEPGSTGDQDIATSFALNTGNDDKAVILLGGGNGTFGTVDTFSVWEMGVVAGDTPVNALLACAARDAAPNMVTHSYCRTGECLAVTYLDAVQSAASLTAWLSTGFRLNWTTIDTTANQFSALVMQGGNQWQVGDALTSTGSTNQVESTNFQPTGLIVGSHCKTESVAGTVQAHDERSLGFATAPTTRSCIAVVDTDAPTSSDIAIGGWSDRIYNNFDQTNAAKTTVQGAMDLVSFDATPSFTYVMDTTDDVENYFWYLATGDDSGPEPVSGSGSMAIATPSMSGTGIRGILGTAAVVLATLAMSGSGTMELAPVTGTGSMAIATPVISGTGIRGNLGSGTIATPMPAYAFGDTIALTQPSFSGTGIRGNVGSGTLATTAVSYSTGTGIVGNIGDGTIAIAAPVMAGAGSGGGTNVSGGGDLAIPDPVIAGIGSVAEHGTGTLAATAVSMSGSGRLEHTGTGDLAQTLAFSGTYTQTHVGSGAVTIDETHVVMAGEGPTAEDVTILVESNFRVVATRAVFQMLTGRHEIDILSGRHELDIPETASDYDQP